MLQASLLFVLALALYRVGVAHGQQQSSADAYDPENPFNDWL